MRYDKSSAIKIMNSYGESSTPFLFMVDFEMQKIIIKRNDEINEDLLFEFPNHFHTKALKRNPNQYWKPHPIEKVAYKLAFEKVMHEINLGNTFLLNLSFPTSLSYKGSLLNIYQQANAKYKLYLKNECTVFSPETFVKIENGNIYSYPMKGTIDANVKNALNTIISDEKEIAEHYTIVDLIRNDLSIVAREVEVTKFRYPDYIRTSEKDLIQISSEIKGKLTDKYYKEIGSLIFAMLPAGSISGAPKKKTVDIIKSVELIDRGYYTGICGYFDGLNLDSGVMIRFVEQKENGLQYRSGGGITFMSELDIEYAEMIDKVYIPSSSNSSIVSSEKHHFSSSYS